jgi:hypothetical protein
MLMLLLACALAVSGDAISSPSMRTVTLAVVTDLKA